MINSMSTPKERILLVEHDPEISDLISRQTLQPMGYQVEVVGTVNSALQEAVRFSPDVIITNLNLPGLSGKDLLVALSSQGLEIPIIVIAPKGMESDVIQAFRLGAADFLNWPIREAEVLSATERILKQGRARREKDMLTRQLNQTNQELQRRVRELTTIFAIGKAVISATDQQSLFNKIMEGATYVAEADSGWLLVREERGKSFILRACHNVPRDISIKMNQPWDDGLSSLVALSGEPLSIHGEPLMRFKVIRLGQSALVVPVKVKKEAVGLLVVARREAQPFSSSQQALLEAVADYASISLVNSRLFRALEERVRTLQISANNARTGEHIDNEMLEEIAQELCQPLKNAHASVDTLLVRGTGRLNTEQTDTIRALQERLKVISDIADFIAGLKRSGETEPLSADLTEVVHQAVARFRPVIQSGTARITLDLPPKPILVRADASHIAKVLDGLLSNAVKFSPSPAQVEIRVEPADENLVRVSVQDHGRGIEEDHMPILFERSFKIEGAKPIHFGGVGIRLPLVKDIITTYGGKIRAESKPGEGSTFIFTLPLCSEA